MTGPMHHIDEPHPFALETARLHYASDRPVVARHLSLEVSLDFERKRIEGIATHRVEAVQAGVRRISFDAVDLDVTSVLVNGRRADFDASSGEQLHVSLPKPLAAGAVAEVKVAYAATPRRGLYFVGPDAAYPKRPRQAWTQGQDIDSRHWFPCLDTPAQKCPSEVTATFPAEMTALSNGRLVGDVKRGRRRTMHFRLDAPHAPYLVTLVVGRFSSFSRKAGATTLRTLVQPGREAEAKRVVKHTARMLALFESTFGRPYPWGDYAQVFVADFIFGGMENTSATTLTDAVLYDARAALDYDADFLVAHELAHQWFGDLLTCRDWPHGWLNEGFATWAEVLWKETAEGRDAGDHQRKVDLDSYLSETSERYTRPLVARRFDEPIDLFDRHLYEKGALVLHELRTRLGDADFFAALRHYVAAHAGGSVESVDLARAVETVTGRNVDRFFDEYVYRAGHPKLKAKLAWEAEAGRVRVEVTQQQEAPCELPLLVELEVQGEVSAHVLQVSEAHHTFFLPAAREPSWCAVDPRRDRLATLEEEKPAGWWRAQLRDAPAARARTSAADALAQKPAAATVAALRAVLGDEAVFHGTRAACAKALGALRDDASLLALVGALKVRHPKVRRAVVAALGAFVGDARAAKALTAVCRKGDASCFVEGEAARALGRVRGAGAFEVLKPMLKRDSFADAVRCGALDGLTALLDARAWPLVVGAAAYGQPPVARRAAVAAVPKLAEALGRKTEAVDVLARGLRDPGFRVRLAAIDAAGALDDERLVGPLSSTPFLDGREQRLAREAVRTLRAKSPPKELASLRGDLEKLKAELRTLRERVERRPASRRR